MKLIREKSRLSPDEVNSLQKKVASVGGKATVVEISGVTHYGTEVSFEEDSIHVLGTVPNRHLNYDNVREIRAVKAGKPVVLYQAGEQ